MAVQSPLPKAKGGGQATVGETKRDAGRTLQRVADARGAPKLLEAAGLRQTADLLCWVFMNKVSKARRLQAAGPPRAAATLVSPAPRRAYLSDPLACPRRWF
jgi:hypothetical protein